MGLFSGAVSAGIGALSSVFGGSISQKQQYGYTKKERLKGPGWDVQGLRDAGLNPILAAQKSGPAYGVGGFAVSPADIAGQMEKISSSSAKDAQRKNMVKTGKILDIQRETELANMQRARNEAHSAASRSSIDANESTLHGMMTDAYIKGRKVLPMIEAISRAGGFGAVSSANDIFRTVRGVGKKLTK